MDPNQKLRLDRINAKGMEVATKLAELKAGKDVELADFSLFGQDDSLDKKERRLRAFLDQINGARKRLLQGGYGVCQACDTEFKETELDEMPWLERCGDCVAADAPLKD